MPTTPRSRLQISLRTLLLGVAVVAAVLGVFRWRFYEVWGASQSYEEASRVHLIASWVPETASDFNYWAAPGRGLLRVNFKIDEAGFLAWAKEHGWRLDKIDAASGGRCVPHIHQEVPGRPRPTSSAMLHAGYVYRKETEEQTGRLLVVAYDCDDQRGYFSQLEQ